MDSVEDNQASAEQVEAQEESGVAGEQEAEGMGSENQMEGESAQEDDIFKNNHDLIGIQGILRAQKNEIEKKKLELRMENERYFRQHPEINSLLQLFVQRILDDRPENILEYAGTFFDSASLNELVSNYQKKENQNAEKQ